MISKEEFVNIMDRLREIYDFNIDVYEIAKNRAEKSNFKWSVDISSIGENPFESEYEDIILELLTNMFNDDKAYISWWMYDLDYGRNYKEYCTQDAEGNAIDISTAEKLYDFLIEEVEEQC